MIMKKVTADRNEYAEHELNGYRGPRGSGNEQGQYKQVEGKNRAM
jgi:hypothetical protein